MKYPNLKAQFYDGVSTKVYNVEVKIMDNSIIIEDIGESLFLNWRYQDIKITTKPEFEQPLFLSCTHSPNARLILPHSEITKALIKKLLSFNIWSIDVVASLKVIGWLLPGTLIFCFALFLLVGPITSFIAKHFPQPLEEKIGVYAFSQITNKHIECKNNAGVQSLGVILNRLNNASDYQQPIKITVIKSQEVNAMALPNNQIIIFSQLIKEAESPEELAGVIAHEMGHIVNRHSVEGIIKAIGLEALIKIIIGDFHSFEIVNQVLQLSYSRDMEREADQFAIKLLYDASISNDGFKAFFTRLNKKYENIESLFSYVSTHPATSERIEMILDSPTKTSRPLLNKQQWKAIKNICQE